MQLDLLRRPGFLLYLAGTVMSSFGEHIQRTALTLLVLRLTGSALDVSGLLFAYTAPAAVFGPVAGTLVDRFSPRRAVIAAELVRGLLVLGLLAAPSLFWMMAIVFVCTLAQRLSSSGRKALLPQLSVPERLVAANSYHASGTRLARTVAPVLGAVLIVSFPPSVVFVLSAGTSLFSAACLAAIPRLEARTGEAEPRASGPGFRRQFVEGFTYLAGDARLKFVISVMTCAMLLSGAIHVLLVLLVKEVAHAGDALYGVLAGSIAAGYVLGGPLAPPIARRLGRFELLAAALLADGVLTGLLPVVAGCGPAAGWILPGYTFILGVESCLAFVSVATIIQETVPAGWMGRVFGFYDGIVNAASSLSLILVGVAVEAAGLRLVMYACGVGLFGCGAVTGTVPRLPGSRLPYVAPGVGPGEG
ncbi:MAG: MFS transporter [Acetobacteraceae bacterium]|nr:MFS transporter [Acetobacteraceae bacterium]